MNMSNRIVTLLASRYGTIKPILVVCRRPYNLESGCVGDNVRCAVTEGISSVNWALLRSLLPCFVTYLGAELQPRKSYPWFAK